METLIFALIASYGAHQQQEQVVAQPEEFQPFALQALRNPTDNKGAGPGDANKLKYDDQAIFL